MKTIVITGSAASGKSKIIRKLAYTLTNKSFTVFVLPETATELLEAGFDSLSNKLQFQTKKPNVISWFIEYQIAIGYTCLR